MTTVLIAGGGTGGHLMPALAIATELRSRGRDVVLVGATRGVEARLLPSRDFRYHLLASEPIYRRQWWKNFRWPLLALRLFRQVDRVLDQERPALVLGTGGYAAGPVVWRAAARGISTAILEQDAVPGLASRLMARRARHVYLGQPETRARLRTASNTEVFVTGCPIAPPDLSLRPSAPERFGLDRSQPVVLITGGSQGALALNQVVSDWIGQGGGEGLQLIWATGALSHEKFRPWHRPPAVQVFDFLDPIAPAYAAADLAITRAGMMTIAELCAWGLACILVPLPTAAADHQTRNAAVMAQAGAAVHLPQAVLTADRLDQEVRALLGDRRRREAMAAAARARGKPGATVEIVTLLERLKGGS
jgi:UDP-N-acetylglucosamine--N-acetylmuramyl-(pentapeptide) pyrophosphoryl-undecaprenol N-acetylglucosamine transferase